MRILIDFALLPYCTLVLSDTTHHRWQLQCELAPYVLQLASMTWCFYSRLGEGDVSMHASSRVVIMEVEGYFCSVVSWTNHKGRSITIIYRLNISVEISLLQVKLVNHRVRRTNTILKYYNCHLEWACQCEKEGVHRLKYFGPVPADSRWCPGKTRDWPDGAWWRWYHVSLCVAVSIPWACKMSGITLHGTA